MAPSARQRRLLVQDCGFPEVAQAGLGLRYLRGAQTSSFRRQPGASAPPAGFQHSTDRLSGPGRSQPKIDLLPLQDRFRTCGAAIGAGVPVRQRTASVPLGPAAAGQGGMAVGLKVTDRVDLSGRVQELRYQTGSLHFQRHQHASLPLRVGQGAERFCMRVSWRRLGTRIALAAGSGRIWRGALRQAQRRSADRVSSVSLLMRYFRKSQRSVRRHQHVARVLAASRLKRR